jgi:Holliday junction resolvase RusA-like endonuclease
MSPISWLERSLDWFEQNCVYPLIRAARGPLQVFEVRGRPMPQERPRVCSKGGKSWAFTPRTSKDYKDKVYWSVAGSRPVKFEPPYTVVLKFICDPSMADDLDYPLSPRHGDVDNLAKSILDAIFGRNKIFSDDRYIIDLISYKRLPEVGEEPCVKIILIK